jgi:hypothetical protein
VLTLIDVYFSTIFQLRSHPIMGTEIQGCCGQWGGAAYHGPGQLHPL